MVKGGKVPDGKTASECNFTRNDLPHEGSLEDGTICSQNIDIIEVVGITRKNGIDTNDLEVDIKNLKTLNPKSISAINIKKKVIEELKNKVPDAKKCTSESCVIKNISNISTVEDVTKLRNIMDKNFNIEGPWDNKTWLNDKNIDTTLKQLTKKYPHFHMLPYKMLDEFVDSTNILNNTDFYNFHLKDKYKKVGFIANQDTRAGSGIHWVAVLIDFDPPGPSPGSYTNPITIEFFNSAAGPIYKEVVIWASKVQRDIQLQQKHCDIIQVSKIQHQHHNTECGVYSLYYIWSRLDGTPWTDFQYKRVPDEQMVEFRKALFRHG